MKPRSSSKPQRHLLFSTLFPILITKVGYCQYKTSAWLTALLKTRRTQNIRYLRCSSMDLLLVGKHLVYNIPKVLLTKFWTFNRREKYMSVPKWEIYNSSSLFGNFDLNFSSSLIFQDFDGTSQKEYNSWKFGKYHMSRSRRLTNYSSILANSTAVYGYQQIICMPI